MSQNTWEKSSKTFKNLNFEKRTKFFLGIVLKIIFSKNLVPGSKAVTCSLPTDRKAKTEEALSGISELLASAHDQGAVQLSEKM